MFCNELILFVDANETDISQLITEAKNEITQVLAWFNETTFNFTSIPVNVSHPAVTWVQFIFTKIIIERLIGSNMAKIKVNGRVEGYVRRNKLQTI